MLRILVAALIAVALQNARAEESWLLLNREDGCVSLGELYRFYPSTRGAIQPAAIHAALRKDFPGAVIKSFLQAVRDEHDTDGTKPDEEEARFYRHFTELNAFVIQSKQGGFELALFTQQLCVATVARHRAGALIPQSTGR